MKQILLLAGFALLAPLGSFGEGVTDFVINPTTGITISTPGNYSLSANVVMAADVHAIVVDANHVTINLNGHSLTAPAGSTTNGITGNASLRMTVRNGSIIGFFNGMQCLGTLATAEDVSVESSASNGFLLTGASPRVMNCDARSNGGWGIACGSGALIEACSATSNNFLGSTGGIQSSSSSVIRGCTANDNSPSSADGSATGISTGVNCVIINCTASGNFGIGTGSAFGILAGQKSVVSGNSACANIAGVNGTNGTGISVGSSTQVFNNVCTGNREGTGVNGISTGIAASANCLIENNICSDNIAFGADGAGRGITCSFNCVIRGNTVINNDAIGAGAAYGIFINSSGCLLEGNSCNGHGGGTAGWGIFNNNNEGVLRGNSTADNATGGIRLNTAAAGAAAVRAERNRIAEPAGFSATAGHSLGTGEDANILY